MIVSSAIWSAAGYPHLTTALASALFAGVWQGAVLVAAVAALFRLLPRTSPALRSTVWLAIFVVLLLLPLLSFHRGAGTLSQAGSGLTLDPLWAALLAASWAVLVCLRLFQLLRSAVQLHRIARTADPFAIPSTPPDGAAGLPVYLSTQVDVPCVIGFFRPRIVLPQSLPVHLSTADLHAIVLHETEHLRRRDDWTNLLQKLGIALFPLHPALLWVERELCRQRELACDDGVLAHTGAPRSYASTLAALAEFTLVRRGLSLALGAWSRRPELLVRVERILARPAQPLGPCCTRAVLGGVLLATGVGAVGLSRAPQFIHFAGPVQLAQTTPLALAPVAANPRTGPFRVVEAAFHPSAHQVDFGSRIAGQQPARTNRTLVPTRVNAYLPHSSVALPLIAHRPNRMHFPERALAMRRHTVARNRKTVVPPFVLLTSWHAVTSTGAMVPTPWPARDSDLPIVTPRRLFNPDFVLTYAAVPVPDGWLIVQL